MQVLMTADTLGGVFTYAVELIRALEAHAVRTVLATFGRPLTAAQRRQLRTCNPLALHESSYALEWMPNPWTDVRASAGWLREIAEQTDPDCIHFNHYAHAGLRWEVPTLVVAHSCVWSWWQAVHGTTPGPEFERYHRTVLEGIHGATRVVAPSGDMLGNIVRDYGLPAHATVIPNGIDLVQFAPRPKLPYVLAAGRLYDQSKNIAALEQVAGTLSWPVYVAGEALAPRGLAADGGTRTTACHPLGPLDRTSLARCLARAAIYALPARYEPFGLSVLEAAASGCALVLGAIPSLLENWHGAACFVDPDDTDGLRDTLERLIANEDERNHWSERARQRATALSAQRMAAHYAEVYAELCPAPRSRSLACAS
jgi:glycosyltransferase involved in cell wall biosynthesis